MVATWVSQRWGLFGARRNTPRSLCGMIPSVSPTKTLCPRLRIHETSLAAYLLCCLAFLRRHQGVKKICWIHNKGLGSRNRLVQKCPLDDDDENKLIALLVQAAAACQPSFRAWKVWRGFCLFALNLNGKRPVLSLFWPQALTSPKTTPSLTRQISGSKTKDHGWSNRGLLQSNASLWRLSTTAHYRYILVLICSETFCFEIWLMTWISHFCLLMLISLLSPAVLLCLAGETNVACIRMPKVGLSSACLRDAKACELAGKHPQSSSVNAFITPFSSKSTWVRGIMPLRSSLPAKIRVGAGPLLGSLRSSRFHLECMASASSGADPVPTGQSNIRLRRAKDALARYQRILDAANEVLDSFLENNSRTSWKALEGTKFDLNQTNLERNVAKAESDLTKAELKVLKEEDAPASRIAEAERQALHPGSHAKSAWFMWQNQLLHTHTHTYRCTSSSAKAPSLDVSYVHA